jgi:hypothetical protein
MPQIVKYLFAHATNFYIEIHLYSFIYNLKCLGQSLLISLGRRRVPTYIAFIYSVDQSLLISFIYSINQKKVFGELYLDVAATDVSVGAR